MLNIDKNKVVLLPTEKLEDIVFNFSLYSEMTVETAERELDRREWYESDPVYTAELEDRQDKGDAYGKVAFW